MSIATAIAAAQQKIANAYTTISNKGGTLPATQNLSNLSTAIDSIPALTPYTVPKYYAWIQNGTCNPSNDSTITSGIVYTKTLTNGAKIYTVPSTLATKPTANDLTETTDTLQNITYGTALGVSSTFAQSATTSHEATYIHRPSGVNENFVYDII